MQRLGFIIILHRSTYTACIFNFILRRKIFFWCFNNCKSLFQRGVNIIIYSRRVTYLKFGELWSNGLTFFGAPLRHTSLIEASIIIQLINKVTITRSEFNVFILYWDNQENILFGRWKIKSVPTHSCQLWLEKWKHENYNRYNIIFFTKMWLYKLLWKTIS